MMGEALTKTAISLGKVLSRGLYFHPRTQFYDAFIASGRSLAMKLAAQKNKKAEH